jgi:NAD(P)-dependent dehydrogenase (short-subunit alcohol dehydrogenase family)
MAGKNIVVTGGGAGIGRGTVEAFAAAKASSITITGRRTQPLEETKKYIESKYGVPVHTFAADVTDEASMKKVAAAVGGWDVLVNNAGYLSTPTLAKEAEVEEWWKGWEVSTVALL